MKTFLDSAGRTWTIAITVDAVRRVRDLVDVNLARIIEPRKAGGEVPLMTDLEDDLLLLVDVIYALVKPQADEAGVSDEEFGRALGGEAIAAAHEAFWRELADFFRSLRRRPNAAEARAIEKQLALVEAALAVAEEKIEALDPEKMIAAAEKKFEEENLRTAGDSSSSAPGSAESPPDR
ncbi:MAG TPA: hypothetical protein VM219_09050 [Phycisphaerae bacterium]|nr:hypothetical protein [Phycisphaerae bacterium]HUX02985.1 hypothetical protein [Phycisphaerae bacterium]